MPEVILSVGIDVGTTTTQLLFSRLELENTAATTAVPRVRIARREVFYRGPVYFTPLKDRETIDATALRAIVEAEYAAAGVSPERISAGAVIITGETARKSNARAVLDGLAGLAGEFVVTSAGADLESLLAGRGAGAARLSNESGLTLANLDIGGGTTNIAVFRNGEMTDSSCLDIGGRHVLIEPQTFAVKAVTPQCARLIASLGLDIREGWRCNIAELRKLTDRLAGLLAEILRVAPASPELEPLITNHDFKHPERLKELQGITFSGGVAAAMGESFDTPGAPSSWLAYGDIGILLAHSIKSSVLCHSLSVYPAAETIRATVVGVGVHIVELSGSTVFYSRPDPLPLKNIPILKLTPEDEANGPEHLAERLAAKIAWFREGGQAETVGLALKGIQDPSYAAVAELAGAIARGGREMLKHTNTLVVLVEHDMAKALGNALRLALSPKIDIFSLDSVAVESGDHIDIGKPVAGGRVLPVVAKTLLFGK